MEKKKENVKRIIIISLVCVIALGIAAYFIFGNLIKKDFRGGNPDFPDKFEGGVQPFNETIKAEITFFFENSPSDSEIEKYCSKNREYCFYYCTNMSGDNEICDGLMNDTQMPPGGEPLQ